MNVAYIAAAVVAIAGSLLLSRSFYDDFEAREVVKLLGGVCALCLMAVGWALDVDARHVEMAATDTTLQARAVERARSFVSSLGLRAAGVLCASHRHHLPDGPVACTVGTESGTVIELSCDPDLPLAERGAPCSLARPAP